MPSSLWAAASPSSSSRARRKLAAPTLPTGPGSGWNDPEIGVPRRGRPQRQRLAAKGCLFILALGVQGTGETVMSLAAFGRSASARRKLSTASVERPRSHSVLPRLISFSAKPGCRVSACWKPAAASESRPTAESVPRLFSASGNAGFSSRRGDSWPPLPSYLFKSQRTMPRLTSAFRRRLGRLQCLPIRRRRLFVPAEVAEDGTKIERAPADAAGSARTLAGSRLRASASRPSSRSVAPRLL